MIVKNRIIILKIFHGKRFSFLIKYISGKLKKKIQGEMQSGFLGSLISF